MRKLKKIDVNFISLVDKGANKKRLIFKNHESTASAIEKTLSIKKYDEEQKIVFCIVYSPEEIDAQGDSASSEVIKEAAYNFMRCARTNNIDKQHDFIPDEGFVAESWIVKENDPVFPAEPAGSWAVGIKVENEDTWQLIKAGEITGVSLAGFAVTEDEEKKNDSLMEKIKELFHHENPPSNEELKNWFFSSNKSSAAAGKCIKNESELNSLMERISILEKNNEILSGRLSEIENSTPASRQLKKEEYQSEEKIKIWT